MTLSVGDGGQLPILGYSPEDLTVLSRKITKCPDHQTEPHFLSVPFDHYCPNLKFNLLSVRHAVSFGYQVKFDHPEHCLFFLDKTYYFRAAVNILGLYSFSATGVPPGSPLPPHDTLTTQAMFDGFIAFLVASPVSSPLPSHPPSHSLVADHPELSGYRTRNLKPLDCDVCEYAKSLRKPFSSEAVFRSNTYLTLVHSDIWSPCPV
ncbi:hypothetical protein DYB35_011813 [Aphanomyces astaci]|nr:hypothetical protein DYB35_011813 [Aphanomyces astaci]